MKNCPNCGAPITSFVCEYCGTPHYKPTDVMNALTGKKAHIWFENDDGSVMMVDCLVTRVGFDTSCDMIYGFGGNVVSAIRGRTEVSIDADLMGFDTGSWARSGMISGEIGRLHHG